MQRHSPLIFLPGKGVSRSIQCRVFQSPLAGVSDQTFRGLVRRWAPQALLFTEMVNASSLTLGHGEQKVKELSKENGPIAVQLFDHRPTALVDAAKKAEAAGAFLIDINMGCPVKKIARKGGGSGLLKNPDLAAEIINAVTNAVKIPVTVKTRLGWCKNSAEPIKFSLLLQDAGAQLLTIHGRTREQGFTGKANWDAIRKVKDALKIPVIANGDINSPEDAIQCLATTNADGIMIGRGSLGAPWLVGQIDSVLRGDLMIKTPGPQERIKIALEQLQDLVERKGDHGLLVARKHMNWTCKGFDGANTFRKSLLHATTPFEAISLLEKKLSSLG